MNELSKYKETFEREIANLDFMKFYKRTILWLFGAFCEFMCVCKVCKLCEICELCFCELTTFSGKETHPCSV